MNIRKIIIWTIILTQYSCTVFCGQQNSFVYVQIEHGGFWDLYPDVHREILSFMVSTTSLKVLSERRTVKFSDSQLFDSTFAILAGSGDIGNLSKNEVDGLQRFVHGGGVIFIDSSEAIAGSSFVRSVKREFTKAFPDIPWEEIPRDQAILRSFYLPKMISGRRACVPRLEGLTMDGFTSVILSQNDLLGAWARDRLGNFLYACTPGGEEQRVESIKLTANVIMYALTGTYKTDAIHIPYILMKLKTKY
jgi:hypothetical protein